MRRSRYKIIPNDKAPYLITCTTINWVALFGFPSVVEILLESFLFLIKKSRIFLHAYVIMENHLHCIVSSENLSQEISNFKSYTARKSIDFFKENGFKAILSQLEQFKISHKKDQKYQIWQEGGHPERIISRDMLNQKIEYIHYNPVRRGYVENPSFW